jgi:hypothetical protein
MDVRLRLQDRITLQERRLLLLVMAMVNDVRQELGMPLLEERDVARLVEQQSREERAV